MAEHNLTELFSDIADAIRAKTGGTANIVADNFPTAITAIPSGGGTYQSKTATPTASEQTITPDTGYDGLSAVTVNPAPLEAKTITPSAQEQVVTPTAPNIGLSSVTVNGDIDLIATNIKRDVSIFGVVGTFEGGGTPTINGKTYDCGTFTPASDITANYTVNHTLGRTPEFLVLWTVNNDFAVQGVIGKWNANIGTVSKNVGVIAANGGPFAATGVTSAIYRSSADATTLTLNCSATYPLLAGVEYQWLVI